MNHLWRISLKCGFLTSPSQSWTWCTRGCDQSLGLTRDLDFEVVE